MSFGYAAAELYCSSSRVAGLADWHATLKGRLFHLRADSREALEVEQHTKCSIELAHHIRSQGFLGKGLDASLVDGPELIGQRIRTQPDTGL